MLGLLVVGSLLDLGLAGFVVLMSGYVFGGHEGMHGETSAVLVWAATLAACFVAIIGGFVLRRYRQPGFGAAVAWLPPVGGLLFALPFL